MVLKGGIEYGFYTDEFIITVPDAYSECECHPSGG